ncbi:MAG: hypothetical protein AAFV30_07440, partial [Pseudomonadota bacterium]
VAGETAGPRVITTYLNDHIGSYGRVASRMITTDGTTTWQRTYNTWDTVDTGNGPFRTQQTMTRTAERYGTALVETKREMAMDVYGELSWERSLGFTVDGVDQTGADDSYVELTYARNLTDYIVDRPSERKTYAGSAASSDRTTWIEQTFFRYDGQTSGVAPTRGNLTQVDLWEGGLTGGVQTRKERAYAYDAYGNVTSEEDARNNATTFTYDSAKHLFRTSETNAVSHSSSTTWNTACQAPATVTDANGNVTTFTYDAHCRETNRALPSGQYEATAYVDFGLPATQHIERTSLSGGSQSGSTLSISREYFDGFGESYKSTITGDTSASADDIVTLRAFDKRGRLSWESIPLSVTQASGTITSSDRVEFDYDPYGRVIETRNPDGSKSTQAFTVRSDDRHGPTIDKPTLHIQDENCHDGSSSTVCGELWRLFDDRGNTIREDRYDAALTDVGAGGSGGGSGNPVVHAPLSSYSNRDNGTFTTSQDGYTVNLIDNAWKQADVNYTVTANTVIRFEFSSSVEGEIHGIGLNDAGTINWNNTFQIHGFETFGRGNYNNQYTTGSGFQF